ncbi:T9SS type A sorting domain-containing protein [bacterium]|nr:T9SS type A sorting domain-containing protein [bacterium]
MNARMTVAALLFAAGAIAGPGPAGLYAKKGGTDMAEKLAGCISVLEKNQIGVTEIIAEINARMNAETKSRIGRKTARILKTEDGTAVETILQTWENGSWVNSVRSISLFDDFHNEISNTDQVWENDAWVNESRMTTTRNANGNITEILFEDWSDGAWVKSAALLYTYDAHGNETSFTMQADANDDGVLDNSMKTTNTYNASNQRVQDDFSFWDSSSNDWMKTSRTEYTYDGQGNLTQELDYTEMGMLSFLDDRTIYTYDASGKMLTKTNASYDALTQTWVDESRSLYQYNAAGDVTETVYQEWDGAAWVNQDRDAFTYDAHGWQIEYLLQEWDNGWVNTYRTQDSWDANGNYIHNLEQKWEGGAWVNEYQSNRSYDGQDRIMEQIDQRWENGAWINENRYLYNWAVGIARLAPAIPETFTLGNVPNPFNPSTTLLFNLQAPDRISVQILDVRGKIVRNLIQGKVMTAGLQRIAWDGTDESGSPAASGVYLYRISGASFNGTGRCLLAR